MVRYVPCECVEVTGETGEPKLQTLVRWSKRKRKP